MAETLTARQRLHARNDRRARFIELVRDAELYGSPEQAAQAEFLATSVARRADDDFLNRHPSEAFPGHVKHTLGLARVLGDDGTVVRCYRPNVEDHGYALPMYVLETVMTDQPFIIDTIKMVLRRMGVQVLGTLNMILPVARDDDGALVDVAPDLEGARNESFSCHMLSAATVGDRAHELATVINRHLTLARRVVEDFRQMRKVLRDTVNTLNFCAECKPDRAEEFTESAEFASWMVSERFVLMGALVADRDGGVKHAWGLSRGGLAGAPGIETDLQTAFATDEPAVSIHVTHSPSPVHRDAHLKEVRIRLHDEDGEPDGGVVIQGLFTYAAVMGAASQVPVLRRRFHKIIRNEDLVPQSHRMKVFFSFFDRLPLEYAFGSPNHEVADLVNEAIDVDFGGTPRMHVRVLSRETVAHAFLLLPSARYGDELRARVGAELEDAFAGKVVYHRLLVGKTDTLLVHFVVANGAGLALPDPDELDGRVANLVRPWIEQLRMMLRTEGVAEELVDHYCLQYGDAMPDDYRRRVQVPELLEDIERLERVRRGGGLQLYLRRDGWDRKVGTVRLMMVAEHDFALTDTLPVLDNFGLRVRSERTRPIPPAEGKPLYLQSYRIDAQSGEAAHLAEHGAAFIEAMDAVLGGHMNSTPLNRLLLSARLQWRQLQVLRAYLAYARQLGTAFPPNLVQSVLHNQPELVRTLIDYFEARFAPRLSDGDTDVVSARSTRRRDRVKSVRNRFFKQLEAVNDVVEDKVLRMFFNFISATIRTNFYQRAGVPRGLSFKFDCAEVELMPEPRPMFEIFVYDPRVEGVHLRGGKVARGGLRWSDRIDDYRTEILDLMQTQMVKNTLIVPVGSKGGFVLTHPEKDDRKRRAQADELYKVFIDALLDVTDNLVDGKVSFPEDVVVYDGEDPYLVVAADKGTAHLSDTANGIALERGFWLGDAFASGGSQGYDHKAYGITARGGWVCVQRHFREMGVDTQSDAFTVVGIGDMSGDVFGNGMLLSETLQLVGAFNHRHIFIDPNPDPAASFAERKRLFELPRSSWEDYDTALISEGGGVYPRSAKSIAISEQARAALGVDKGSLSGEELIQALLRAPVDLLWNGGIGTYVKASDETDLEVGDKSNDRVRVDATELRCKVVGEGGNLGFTHAARVEFGLRGGRINTDAIDNSGGVDLSDHEVNLKILFAPLLQSGVIDDETRNKVLFEVDEDCVDDVLRNNDTQSMSISIAEADTRRRLEAWDGLIAFLCRELGIDRAIQLLPSSEELRERQGNRQGLSRAEISRVNAFSKMWLYDKLVSDPGSSGRVAAANLARYFPATIRERFADAVDGHSLRHQIVCTVWVNETVDFAGALLVPSLAQEFERSVSEIANAYAFAVDVLGARTLREQLIGLNFQVGSQAQYEALATVEEVLAAATRWLLSCLDADALEALYLEQERLAAFGAEMLAALASLGRGTVQPPRRPGRARSVSWKRHKMPDDIVASLSSFDAMSHIFGVWALAQRSGLSAERAVRVYFASAAATGLLDVVAKMDGHTPESRWDAIALANLRRSLSEVHVEIGERVGAALPEDATVTRASVARTLSQELGLSGVTRLAQDVRADGGGVASLLVLAQRATAELARAAHA